MADYKLLTTREMETKGYTLSPTSHPGVPSTCRQCGAEIEWWRSPNGKSIPYDPCSRDDQYRVCHFGSCSGVPGQAPKPAPMPSTGLFPSVQAGSVEAIGQKIKDEYKAEHEGDAGYMEPRHAMNWLFKQLVKARLALRDCGLAK